MLLHRLGVRPGGAVAFDSAEAADADADDAPEAAWVAAAAAAGGDAVAAGHLRVGALKGVPPRPNPLPQPRPPPTGA